MISKSARRTWVFIPEGAPANRASRPQASRSAAAGFAAKDLPLERGRDVYAQADIARLHERWDDRTPIGAT